MTGLKQFYKKFTKIMLVVNMKNSCRLYELHKYKSLIERDEDIAEELQDGNKSNRGAESQDS